MYSKTNLKFHDVSHFYCQSDPIRPQSGIAATLTRFDYLTAFARNGYFALTGTEGSRWEQYIITDEDDNGQDKQY